MGRRDLVAEFTETFRKEVLRRLGPDAEKDLGAQPLAQLLITYGNWRDRFPTPNPRTVHVSSAVKANTTHAAEVQGLIRKISAGEDLRPHLSKRVETATAGPRTKRCQAAATWTSYSRTGGSITSTCRARSAPTGGPRVGVTCFSLASSQTTPT